jgi:hypothetical protein
VRDSLSIHLKPGAVKSPEQIRFLYQKLRVSALIEIEFSFIRRIVVPESLVTSKIRKA